MRSRGRDAEQHGLDDAADRHTGKQADSQADDRRRHPLSHHQADDLARAGAQRHANADIPSPLTDDVAERRRPPIASSTAVPANERATRA